MRLYSGSSSQFIKDTTQALIVGKLSSAFFDYYRFHATEAELRAWNNSLTAISEVFQETNLMDHGVILEYQLPLTSKRLDCLICGKDGSNRNNAVIIELKQWEKCEPAPGELVLTWISGAHREVLHPSVQVGHYKMYLEDTHTSFYDPDPVHLNACSYLHNYNLHSSDSLLDKKFKEYTDVYPVFTKDRRESFKPYLLDKLKKGMGQTVLQKIDNGHYKPSKKLMDHVGNIIRNNSEYILLDEQLVVYDKVLTCAREGLGSQQKTAIIIKGGPGTGKSVIAINLLADLLLNGKNAHYATGSRAFTETLRKIIGTRGSVQFKYFNSYAQAEAGQIDVLIADEAHRIRKTSNNRYMRREFRSNTPQVDELLKASKVSVFFIDDNQVVRPDEIGSVRYIRESAQQHDCKIFEYKLDAQFRCNGSDAFVNWINNTLGIEKTANVIWDQHEEFDFKIIDSPHTLEKLIREKVKLGYTGRVTAGFCWPWSLPDENGYLLDDVVIGGYRRPWDAKPEARKLATGIPKASLWAYDPNGINQVGCVYTAQGFEFDYVGVIFGEDLRYGFDEQTWIGDPTKSADNVVRRSRGNFIDLVKNTYRVLLTRGMKGCYVYFMNKETERFFKSRIEGHVDILTDRMMGTIQPEVIESAVHTLPFRILSAEKVRPFENAVPVYDLKIAAGRFSAEQQVSEVPQADELLHPDEFKWAELPDAFRPQRGLFIAQVVGESMNRRIPNGAWCIFRLNPKGTRQGKVVLVQHRDIHDAETGGHFTVKVYESKKEYLEDNTWKHEKIILRPDSTRSEFKPLVFDETNGSDLIIIAETVAVLG
jgi:DUF2075 family protein